MLFIAHILEFLVAYLRGKKVTFLVLQLPSPDYEYVIIQYSKEGKIRKAEKQTENRKIAEKHATIANDYVTAAER